MKDWEVDMNKIIELIQLKRIEKEDEAITLQEELGDRYAIVRAGGFISGLNEAEKIVNSVAKKAIQKRKPCPWRLDIHGKEWDTTAIKAMTIFRVNADNSGLTQAEFFSHMVHKMFKAGLLHDEDGKTVGGKVPLATIIREMGVNDEPNNKPN